MITNTTATRPNYRIFISHNKADNELARYLANELRRLLEDYNAVWLDLEGERYSSRAGIRPSDDWPEEISVNLRNSNVFLLLWSRHARRARWVQHEIKLARYLDGAKGLKIITICIDESKPPVFWQHYQYIKYSSNDNTQIALDGVLRALGLPPNTDDPETRAANQALFELKEAFKRKEWATVKQKFSLLVYHYQMALSASTFYRQAIALFEQGGIQESRAVLDQGLVSNNDEQDAQLLYEYVMLLMKKNYYRDVYSLAQQAIQKFPNDPRWYQLRDQVFMSFNTNSSFISQAAPFISPGQNTSSNATRTTLHSYPISNSAFLNDYSATATTKLNDKETPNVVMPNNFYLETPMTERVTEQIHIDPGEFPHVITKLTEEDQLVGKSGTLQTVNTFTEEHLPEHRLSQVLLTPFWITLLIINLLLLPLVFSIWTPPVWLIWVSTIAILLIQAAGRIVGKKALGFAFAFPFSLFWGAAGYCFGYYLYHSLELAPNISLSVWLVATCSVLSWAGGFYWHQRLFRKQEKALKH